MLDQQPIPLDDPYAGPAEQAMRANMQWAHLNAELASDYVYSLAVDADGTLRPEWLSDSVTPITGFSRADLAAPNIWRSLVHPDDAAIAERRMCALLAGHADISVVRIVTRGGAIRWLRDIGFPFWDAAAGRVVRISGIAQDITRRKEIDERQAFLAQASVILAASNDVEGALGELARLAAPCIADWCALYVIEDQQSPRLIAAAHADAARSELVAALRQYAPIDRRSGDFMRAIHAGRSILLPEVSGAELTGLAADEQHLALLRGLGLASALLVPLVARGCTLGLIACASADSGRRYRPDDLPFIEELARHIAMAIDQARLYQAAQAAARAREELLSVVSHDLKNLLAVSYGYTQVLQRRLTQFEGPEHAWMADMTAKIVATSARMTRSIKELLDVARLQAGRSLELNRVALDLVALARQIASEYHLTDAARRFQVRAFSPTLVGDFDALRLARVLDNLLAVMIRYRPRGSEITIVLEQEERDDGAWAMLAISDRSLHIPTTDMARMRASLGRTGNAAAPHAGADIGLASSYRIVRQHGGQMFLVSRDDTGTAFSVYLPLTT
jgi:PAS domain S-box-containing protein